MLQLTRNRKVPLAYGTNEQFSTAISFVDVIVAGGPSPMAVQLHCMPSLPPHVEHNAVQFAVLFTSPSDHATVTAAAVAVAVTLVGVSGAGTAPGPRHSLDVHGP